MTVVSALPSHAEAAQTPADMAVAAVEAVAEQPGTGPIEDAAAFVDQPTGALTLVSEDATVSIEAGESPTVELASDRYAPLYVNGALPGTSDAADDGTTVFATPDGYSVVPLPYEDGSLQVINVLQDEGAPERFEYHFSSTSPVTVQVREGFALLEDGEGEYLGAVASPWAYDAHGSQVPTRFETDGNVLAQIVDHRGGDFAYPITADPYMGRALWQWITVDSYNGDRRVNLQPTDFGRGVPPWVMTGAGWSEAVGWGGPVPIGPILTGKATMRQQFDCHAFGNAFAGVWNLERSRPNRTIEWTVGVPIHRCNWNTPDRY